MAITVTHPQRDQSPFPALYAISVSAPSLNALIKHLWEKKKQKTEQVVYYKLYISMKNKSCQHGDTGAK